MNCTKNINKNISDGELVTCQHIYKVLTAKETSKHVKKRISTMFPTKYHQNHAGVTNPVHTSHILNYEETDDRLP